MSDIIDEILTTPAPHNHITDHMTRITTPHITTPRITTPHVFTTHSASSLLQANSSLKDSLLREISDQWKQTRQLVSECLL